jgi:hypothetical protein
MTSSNYDETKEWLLNHCNKIYTSGTEYDLLYQLIQKHPSYQNWKYNIPYAFKIVKKQAVKLYISFVMNEKHTRYRIVSWVNCAKGTIRKVDPLSSAMRQSIKRQIGIYKKNNPNYICILCESTKKIEVDHIVKFVDLKNQFINNVKVPETFDYHPKRGYYMFKKSDHQFKKQWQKYHLQYASYRYLCSSCNKKCH